MRCVHSLFQSEATWPPSFNTRVLSNFFSELGMDEKATTNGVYVNLQEEKRLAFVNELQNDHAVYGDLIS